MVSDALKTLLHPFDQGLLSLPQGARALFLGAGADLPRIGVLARAELVCVQGFRPVFLALRRAGWQVRPEPAGEGYDVALVLAGRHRGQNEAWVAEAVDRTRPGGLVVVAGGKTDGIGSLHKRVARQIPIAGHAAKHHGLVFWIEKALEDARYIYDISGTESLAATGPQTIVDSLTGKAFATAPGMFSHEHVDPGSRLLADCLPAGLKGSAADFCAGWGYLTVALADRAPGVASVDLYEADHASLEAARANVGAMATQVAARFFWHDLVGEPVAPRYDLIVMNPPFHTGRAAEPGLGAALIEVAARSLHPGGQLFMVANRQLPYEVALSRAFSKVERLREDNGFKIFQARR